MRLGLRQFQRGRTAVTQPANTATDAQKPSEVAAPAVVGTSRASKRAELIEPSRSPVPDTAAGAAPLDAGYPPVMPPVTVTLPLDLLTEALTVLTIYAEVAVPVASYRGQPLSAHAPRELVERIHRAIGV